MLFAHDTEVALQAAAALVNTDDPDGEQLPDLTALDGFVRAWGWSGDRQRDQAELESVRELRPQAARAVVRNSRRGGGHP